MKKVIKGKLYNTETAICLAKWNNDSPIISNYCSEALYLTKSGAYFLFGCGGTKTRYAVACGNDTWIGSEQIQPMEPDAARQWVKEHLTEEEYKEIFEEPEASETKVLLNLSVSQEFKNSLIKMREETGKSISQIIEDKFSE